MTVKEYLSQAFVLNKLIKAKRSRIEDLRNKQYLLGGGLSDVKVQTSIAQDRVGDVIAELLDLIAECEKDIMRLLDIQKEIEATIETLTRSDLKLILYERYVNLKRWEDIAADNNYSWGAIHNKHRAGLLELEKNVLKCTLQT